MEASEQLLRASLGRVGFIGELYDARTESLSSMSLFNSSLPSKFIQKQDSKKIEYDYKITENISEKFDLLHVEAELQLSVLFGLVHAKGSGKFLTEEKKSEKSVACSLVSKVQTVTEKFFGSFDEMVPYIDLNALANPQNTHIIMEISWGANCLLNLEVSYESNSERKELEGNLKAQFGILISLLSVEGSTQLETTDRFKVERKNVAIKVNADLVPENEWPTSLESFFALLSDIPNLLKKTNDGKGVPLHYRMIPLNPIRKIAKLEGIIEVIVQKIDESFIISTICLFEEIAILKQKFNDLIKDFIEYDKYLAHEDVKQAKEMQRDLKLKESRLKSLIAEDWSSVKSGSKTLRDIIRRIEKFKSHDLNIFAYEDFLDSCAFLRQKLVTIKNYISHNVHYLGKDESFVDVVNQNLSTNFIVLVISSEAENTDPDLFQKTSYHFLTLATEKEVNTNYVVVDLDLKTHPNKNNTNKDNQIDRRNRTFFSKIGVTPVRCVLFKGINLLNSDLLQSYLIELESNFMKRKKDIFIEYCEQKPVNRVTLEMSCPASRNGCCSFEKLSWKCAICKADVEYGFDKFFYCLCGRGAVSSFEYRCSNLRHGDSFVSADSKFIEKEISILRPFKELNILVIGQTGVGKSTWINSTINYLKYNTLEEAKSGGVICTIPISFNTHDRKTFKKRTIELGERNANENHATGESSTQFSHTYHFIWKEKCVRLIDTPGIGDTRGIEQDKMNVRNIIDHISHLKELHAICILMKSNENKIDAIFSYCLKEILVHLHRSVTKNITFCFTNSRISLYTPGETSVLLDKLFKTLGLEGEITLGQHNAFALDNEAFLFLCTLQYPDIEYEEELVSSFAKSWEISCSETKRLFETVTTFKPHVLNDTLSLVKVRTRILTLTKPVAEISKTIQLNLTVMNRKLEEIKTSTKTLEELSKKLYLDEIHLQPVKLSYPRTVCASPSCVEYHKNDNLDVNEIEYKTHCHVSCYLKDVETRTTNNIKLKRCTAMTNGICQVCGCGWQNHIHITFDQKRVVKQVKNRRVFESMTKEEEAMQKIKEFVDTLKLKTDKYKKEQEIIIQTSVKFGRFLKENAISVYNDAIADYLQYLIQEEENKPHKSSTEEELLRKLKETLMHYEAEVEILQNVIKKSGDEMEKLSVEDINELERKLYDLELSGPDIKKNVEASRKSTSNAFRYAETSLDIRNHRPLRSSTKERREHKNPGILKSISSYLLGSK